jgi:hypothetical protein
MKARVAASSMACRLGLWGLFMVLPNKFVASVRA